MSNEQTIAESAGAAATAAKYLSAPAAVGILAAVVGFMFSWPRTKREGFTRIAASGLCSHFFGPGVLATAVHFLPWITADDIRAACYLAAGLPGWWVLGWGFKWLQTRQDQDAGQVAGEIVHGVKRVREIL